MRVVVVVVVVLDTGGDVVTGVDQMWYKKNKHTNRARDVSRLESWLPCCHHYCCSVVVTVAAAVAYVMTVVHVTGGQGREMATGVVLSWRG